MDTDHNHVFAKVRDKLAISKHAAEIFDGKRFNLRTLNEMEGRKQYQTGTSPRFAALENFSDGKDTNRASENIKQNTKISEKDSLGLYELKHHKPRFD
jgi:hypothetical protein